jgi:hypothetical protein
MPSNPLDATLDASAIGLSGLCLAHCLLLPVAAALLPALAVAAEAEWLHLAFAASALPIAGLALARAHRRRPLAGACAGDPAHGGRQPGAGRRPPVELAPAPARALRRLTLGHRTDRPRPGRLSR